MFTLSTTNAAKRYLGLSIRQQILKILAFSTKTGLKSLSHMNKKQIFEKLKLELQKNLETALTAAQNTYDIATHEDNKAENKYDTRGLEASYLAGAQAERVRDLRETLGHILNTQLKFFSSTDKIALTALVQILANKKNIWVLLLPKGGGQSFMFEDKLIQVITPESPLGKGLVGKQIGETLQINNKNFEIEKIT